jgi:hypothetical protein
MQRGSQHHYFISVGHPTISGAEQEQNGKELGLAEDEDSDNEEEEEEEEAAAVQINEEQQEC